MTARSALVAFCSSALLLAPALPAAAQTLALPTAAAPATPAPDQTDAATNSQFGAGQPIGARQPKTSTPSWPDTNVLRQSAPPLVPSLSQIFTETARDFTRLPSMQNGLILGVAAGLAAAVEPSDQRMSDSFSRNRGAAGFFNAGATLGQTWLQVGASLTTYAVGRASGNSKLAILGADLARAQLLSEGTIQAAKLIAGRTRPNGERGSFPSGHASVSFATATVLQEHYGWKVGIPAYAFATYVGASRIQVQKHYLSDVVFGAAVGIVAGRTVTVGLAGRTFALTPIAGSNGGVGVGFTRLPKK